MVLNLRFGEFNFGCLSWERPRLLYSKMILILAKAHQFAKISSRQNYPLYGKKQISSHCTIATFLTVNILGKCNIKLIINPFTGVDWFAVMVTLFIVFVMYSTVPVLES